MKNDTLNSRLKHSDYTLCQGKLLENHTLHSGTYLFSQYMAVPPPPPPPPPAGSRVPSKERAVAILSDASCWGYCHVIVIKSSGAFAKCQLQLTALQSFLAQTLVHSLTHGGTWNPAYSHTTTQMISGDKLFINSAYVLGVYN